MPSDRSLPDDAEQLYELFMSAAWGVSKSVEAAYKLAFETDAVRQWLVAEELVALRSHAEIDYAEINFSACSQRLIELRKYPQHSALDKSSIAVVEFVISLAGEGGVNVRLNSNMNRRDVKRVVEAIMYASGFMDGFADPTANDGPRGGDGPNAVAHDRRIDKLLKQG